MAGSNKNIDKLFKEKLGQRHFDIPEAFLNDIDGRLDALQQKRRKGVWWFFGVLFVALIGVGGVFLYNSNQQNADANSESISSLILENKTIVDKKTEEIIQDDSESINEESDSKSDEFVSLNTSILQGAKDDENLVRNQSFKAKQTNDAKGDSRSSLKSNLQTKNTEKPNQQSEIPIDFPINTNDYIPSNIEEFTADVFEAKSEKSPINQDIITEKEELESSVDFENEDSIVNSLIEGDSKDEIAENTADLEIEEENKESEIIENPSLQKLNTNLNRWRYELQLYSGFGSNFFTDKSGNNEYLSRLNDNNQSIMMANAGINANFSYRQFTFGTGIEFSQTGEKYTYDEKEFLFVDSSYFDVETTEQVISYYAPWGEWLYDSTIYSIDSSWVTETLTDTLFNRKSVVNRYSWISIPVHFGYRFPIGKLELVPRVGAQFYVGIAKNIGAFPDASFIETEYITANKFNVSLYGQVELRYNFSRWHLFVAPYFKSMIEPTINEAILSRNYSNWGVNIGVGIKL